MSSTTVRIPIICCWKVSNCVTCAGCYNREDSETSASEMLHYLLNGRGLSNKKLLRQWRRNGDNFSHKLTIVFTALE